MSFARSIPRCFGVCALFAVPVFAQTTGKILATFNGPPQSVGAAIIGVPFTIEMQEEQWPVEGDMPTGPKTDMPLYRLLHDSAGRSRIEIVLPSGTLVEIRDSVGRYQYVLDPARQIVHRVRLPGESTIPESNSDPRQYISDSLLDEIKGVPVGDGTLMCRTGGMMGTVFETGRLGNERHLDIQRESWVFDSPPFRHVRERSKAPKIQLGDPDSTLFEVPAGYRVVDESGPFTIEFAAR